MIICKLYVFSKVDLNLSLMYEIKETGGAKIGLAQATWPFATLKVNREQLEFNATIIGNLRFRPTDVISIEPCGIVFKNGIRINHMVNAYSSKVIFTTSDPAGLIRRIEQTGFLSNKDPLPVALEMEIADAQSRGAFPLKMSAVIAIVVIWNVLFLADSYKFFNKDVKGSPLGIGAKLAMGFMVMVCIATLISKHFRSYILKEGRPVSDIKVFLYFLMLISGIMLLMSSIIP